MTNNPKINMADLQQKAKLPAKQAGGSTVKSFFEANKQALSAVLPKHVSAERLTRIALGALRSTPKLMEATTESLFSAVVQCAQLGLEPNTPLGHAYLIPFRNNRENRTDVQVIFGYRGLVDLARRSGQIKSISARVVHSGDQFSYGYGLDEHCEHTPGGDGKPTHVYAVAQLVGGGHAFEVLTWDQVARIRDEALQKLPDWKRKTSPWTAHEEEMARKTAIRRLFKYLPVSIEMATASHLDATAGTQDQHIDAGAVLEGEFEVENPYADMGSDEEEPEPDPAKGKVVDAEFDPDESETEWPRREADPETGEEMLVDSSGAIWDPEQHSANQSVNADGTFRAKRNIRRRPPGADQKPAEDLPKRAPNGQEIAQERREPPADDQGFV